MWSVELPRLDLALISNSLLTATYSPRAGHAASGIEPVLRSLGWECGSHGTALQQTNMEPGRGPLKRTITYEGPVFRFHASLTECIFRLSMAVAAAIC